MKKEYKNKKSNNKDKRTVVGAMNKGKQICKGVIRAKF